MSQLYSNCMQQCTFWRATAVNTSSVRLLSSFVLMSIWLGLMYRDQSLALCCVTYRCWCVRLVLKHKWGCGNWSHLAGLDTVELLTYSVATLPLQICLSTGVVWLQLPKQSHIMSPSSLLYSVWFCPPSTKRGDATWRTFPFCQYTV